MDDAILKLLDAICEAYDLWHNPQMVAGNLQTYCNESIQHVCGRMGYTKFKDMVANQIVDFMSRSSDWQKVNLADAQGLANQGKLLIAGQQADPHGHVVVLMPGNMQMAGHWNVKVPRVSNVGEKSYIGRTLNWAFAGDAPPDIWMLVAEVP